MAREYILKSPGKPGGLVPLAGPAAPDPVPVPLPPDPLGEMLTAVTGIPVRICGTGGHGAAAARGARVAAAPAHAYPADTGSRLMGKEERTSLAILAGQAFAVMCRQDPDYLPDMIAQGFKKTYIESEWRHSQVKEATRSHPDGMAHGLSKARRSQYRTIKAHFLALMGQDVESLNTAMTTGPAFGKAGAEGDRAEDCEQALAAVRDVMARYKLNLYYVQAVCGGKDGTGGKFHTRRLESLTAKQLWQLVYTLRNRAAARDGRGNSNNRNKGQRKRPPSALPDNQQPPEEGHPF